MPNCCVYLASKSDTPLIFSCSTKRSPLPAGAATQPLRAPIPSGHADVSGSRVQPENGHANARDEESGDYAERKPARYV